jgi:hypothetical protein
MGSENMKKFDPVIHPRNRRELGHAGGTTDPARNSRETGQLNETYEGETR